MSDGGRRSPEAAKRAAANAAEYRALRRVFGPGSARASGYLSERSFLRERELVLAALGKALGEDRGEDVGEAPGILLDIGCGGGAVTRPLVSAERSNGPANGRAVVGLEWGAGACEAAARAGLLAVRGDALDLPFSAGAADAAVSIEMAQEHESAEVERMLREAARVLRPRGRLLLVWGNRAAWVHRLASSLLSVLGRLRRSSSSFAPPFHHEPAFVRAAAADAGFEMREWWALFPPWRLRFRGVGGPWVRLLGSSFLAVFEKAPAPVRRPGAAARMEPAPAGESGGTP